LVGGQAADLQRAESPINAGKADLPALESIHRRKTGALFVAALELGAIVTRANAEQEAALTAYGTKVGLAFQITDDLLDVSGNQAAVGKRVAKDAGRGKLTFPALLGAEESRCRAKTLIDEACAMIEVFGPRARPLQALAEFVCSRER
jgi:geranylgeranyl diphosphate synthase, type II